MEDQVYGDWKKYRPLVYKRDKGICWVCGSHVIKKDYHLGHIIDNCVGGKIDMSNLTVMHEKCNLSKPLHLTMQEALKWREFYIMGNQPPTNKKTELAKQAVLDYFGKYNYLTLPENKHLKSRAIRKLAKDYNVCIVYVRQWIVQAGIVEAKVISYDPQRYYYINKNIEKLYVIYIHTDNNYVKTTIGNRLNLNNYGVDIFLYFIKKHKLIPYNNLHAISKKAKELNLKIHMNIFKVWFYHLKHHILHNVTLPIR